MSTTLILPAEREFKFPYHCAACLTTAEGHHDVALHVTKPLHFDRDGVTVEAGRRTDRMTFTIPYCEKHLRMSLSLARRHRAARRWRLWLSLMLAGAAGGGTAQAIYYWTQIMEEHPAVFAGATAAAAVAGLVLGVQCCGPLAARLHGLLLPLSSLRHSPEGTTLAVQAQITADRTTGEEQVRLQFARRAYADFFRETNGL